MTQKINVLIYIVCLLNYSYSNCQSLRGKWLLTKDVTDISTPSISIFEFDDEMLYHYNFDELIDSTEIKVSKNLITTENSSFNYSFLDDNLLSLEIPILNKKDLINFKYLRLQPTITSKKDWEIENMIFKISWLGTVQEIYFGKLVGENLFKLERNTDCELIKLEQIEGTYFISIYCYNRRRYVFPIRKITENETTIIVPSRGNETYDLPLINKN